MTPLDELVRRAAALGVRAATTRNPAILGITGEPGAGKSTLAELLIERLEADLPPASVARVQMDGFHLADAALERLGRRDRKGAIDTFDGWGYLAALRRLKAETDHTVYLPDFERTIEQPIAGSVAVGPSVHLIVTEGNYLLDAEEPWPAVRAELAEVWYVEIGDALRRERLVARHIRFGKSPGRARRWVDTVDEPNARRIRATRQRADLVVDMAAIEAGIQARSEARSG